MFYHHSFCSRVSWSSSWRPWEFLASSVRLAGPVCGYGDGYFWCLWSWRGLVSIVGRSSLMLLLYVLVKVCVMRLVTLAFGEGFALLVFLLSPSLVKFQKLGSKSKDFVHEMHCVSGCVALNAPPPLWVLKMWSSVVCVGVGILFSFETLTGGKTYFMFLQDSIIIILQTWRMTFSRTVIFAAWKPETCFLTWILWLENWIVAL